MTQMVSIRRADLPGRAVDAPRWRWMLCWLAGAGGICGAWAGGGCSSPSDAQTELTRPKTAVQVLPVREEQLDEHLELSGDVTAWEVLPLSFKVGGRLARLLVDEGEQIRRGQLVAVLDPKDYQLQSELAQSQVEALKPHLERARFLRQEKALPQAELDKIQSRMNAAKIQQSQANAQLTYARLRAPMDGVVLMKRVAVGDMVGTTRPVIVMANLKTAKVVFPVAQRDLPRFHPGQKITMSAVGVEGTVQGVVDRVGYAAEPETRTFPVTVKVQNEDLRLRAGMIVQAKVKVATHQGFFLPLDVVSRDNQGRHQVYVVDTANQTAQQRTVELGALVGHRVHVTGGLRSGDQVIVRGLVRPGEPVTVQLPPEQGQPAQEAGR